jgi:hypothetical protein
MMLIAVSQTLGAAAADPEVTNIRHFQSLDAGFWVRAAVEGAARRLRVPECARLFGDFVDRDGHRLSDRLKDLGVGPEEYLRKSLWFMDGTRESPCDPLLRRTAITQVGSHVVFICPARFLEASQERELTIIHEMLHSLGLGENPPSSREITGRVMARCGKS